MPHSAHKIGVLNPSSSSFTTIDISNTISSDRKYEEGVLGPNGLIYFVPWDANNIGKLHLARILRTKHESCVRGGRRRARGMELFVVSSLQQVLRFSKTFNNRLMETHHIFFLKSKIKIAKS